MPNISVENGDLSELDRKIVVYSRVKDKETGEIGVVTFYLSESIDDIVQKTSYVLGEFNERSEFLRDVAKNLPKVSGFFYHRFTEFPERDLYWTPDTVVFAGEFNDNNENNQSVGKFASGYFARRYFAKAKKEFGKPNQGKSSAVQRVYEDIPCARLYDYMMDHFVTPIAGAVILGDKKTFTRVKRQFAAFSYGSCFYDDAGSLVRMIDDSGKKYDVNKIGKSVASLVLKFAVEQEEYETAAKMRDIIAGKKVS